MNSYEKECAEYEEQFMEMHGFPWTDVAAVVKLSQEFKKLLDRVTYIENNTRSNQNREDSTSIGQQ